MKYIGKLDGEKLGKYKNKIVTQNVIITNERIEHIKKRHLNDYEKYINHISDIIKNPDYILIDKDKIDTLMFLKRILDNTKNIIVIVKLNTEIEKIEMSNSILTFWQIRNVNYEKVIKNNIIVYKSRHS